MAQELIHLSIWSEIRLLLALGCLCTLPGSALLFISNGFPNWRLFERALLAVGVSISFYPILFYATKLLAPIITLGPLVVAMLLLFSLMLIIIPLLRQKRFSLSIEWYERVAIAILTLTAASRLWVAHIQPIPAWTDSLHHAMITHLTAQNGYLPGSLQPYFEIPLTVYHLGLYTIAASATWIAQVPDVLALQWTAQFLNSLAGIGVYLILIRLTGPIGALAGLAYVGLFSHQPAYYVNWGRYTQLASQVIMPIAWIATFEIISQWNQSNLFEHRHIRQSEPVEVTSTHPPKTATKSRWLLSHALLASMLTSGLFLLHFRVAVFYIALLMITILWLLYRAMVSRQLWPTIQSSFAVGLFSLLFILPAIGEIIYNYYITYIRPIQIDFPELLDQEMTEQFVSNYYSFSLELLPVLSAHTSWLYVVAVSAVLAVAARNKLALLSVIWIIFLFGLGSAHLLGIKGLSITNMGAIFIMLYLPFSLIIGSAAQEISNRLPWNPSQLLRTVIATAAVIALVPFAQQRATSLEQSRFFVTNDDLQAMVWIENNVPSDDRFAVQTTFWLPLSPHGIDGGYWIPYFTGHQTTVGTMLTAVSFNEHHKETIALSRIVKDLEADPQALSKLVENQVDYIYLGSSGFQTLSALKTDSLIKTGLVEIAFQNEGVTILHIQ